jgi:pyridoxine kinase
MAKLCGHADIIVPNLTEAAFLLNEEYVGDVYTKGFIEDLLKRLTTLGCGKVVLTGVSFDPSELGAAGYDQDTGEISYYFGSKVDGYFHGTGDVFGSALLSALLHDFSLADSIRIAVDYTHVCIEKTVESGQERRYGVCFEQAMPELINLLGLQK